MISPAKFENRDARALPKYAKWGGAPPRKWVMTG